MITAVKNYVVPNNLKEALSCLQDTQGKIIAGGTDMMPNFFQENEQAENLIDISKLHELKYIKYENSRLHIGALITLEIIENHELVLELLPVLAKAAKTVGSPLIRTNATLGGNLLCENRCLYYNQSAWWREAVGHCLKCNGDVCIATGGPNACFSEFVSDTAPVLIACGAQLKFIKADNSEEVVDLSSIYTGDGVNPRMLPENSILTEIIVPIRPQRKFRFKKLRLRKSMDFTSMTAVVMKHENGDFKIVIAGMDPAPVVIEAGKGEKMEELLKRTLKKCRAVDNDVFSRIYRRNMMKLFISESINQLLNE